MLRPKERAIVSFRAFHVPTLTTQIAANLEVILSNLPGVKRFTISLEQQELLITFDQRQLDFQILAREMARAGCFLRDINVALLF